MIKGANKIDPEGHSTILTGAPDAENSLADPTNIVPSAGTFKAGSSFEYTFPANSIVLLRLHN